MADISKIQLPGFLEPYNIKDAEARRLIGQMQGVTFHKCTTAADTPVGVEWMSGSTKITGTLEAEGATKSYIYLVFVRQTATKDFYDEYIPVNISDTSTENWIWERIGSTDIDIDDLGAFAYADTGTGSATITTADSASFSNGAVTASGSYTPTGSVSVVLTQTATAATLTKGDYTPAGTVSKPNVVVTPTEVDVYSKKTDGSVTAGTAATFTQGVDTFVRPVHAADVFVEPTWSASVDNEVLSFSFSAGSFTQGEFTQGSFTRGIDTFTANTPTAVTLPTFEKKTVLSAVAAELESTPIFTGTKATNALVTGVTYDKATVQSATFTGTAGTVSVEGTATGDVSLTKTAKTVTVPVSPVAKS